MNRRRLPKLLLPGLFALAACGGSVDVDVAVAEGAAEPTPTSPGQDVGGEAPSGTSALPTGAYPTIDGGQIELTSLEGQDVVLWFWAPW